MLHRGYEALFLFCATAALAPPARADAEDPDLAPIFSASEACDFTVRGTVAFPEGERLVLEPRAEPIVLEVASPRLVELLGEGGACGMALRYAYRALGAEPATLHVELRRGAGTGKSPAPRPESRRALPRGRLRRLPRRTLLGARGRHPVAVHRRRAGRDAMAPDVPGDRGTDRSAGAALDVGVVKSAFCPGTRSSAR